MRDLFVNQCVEEMFVESPLSAIDFGCLAQNLPKDRMNKAEIFHVRR